MKIAFEAKRAFNNFTGLGNYARFVINSVDKHLDYRELLLYTPTVLDHSEAQSFYRKYKEQVVLPKGIYNNGALKKVWRSASIYKNAVKENADIFHGLSNELPSGYNSKTKRIVTIHDLIFLRYPEYYPFIDRNIYKRKFKIACTSSDAIIAVSEQTKADIIEFLSIPEEKIQVVYQGVHDNYHIEIGTERMLHLTQQYGLHRPYLLYVGSIEERKNALQMVKAFKRMKEQHPKDETLLILVGKKTKYQEAVEKEIKQLNLIEDVLILNKVPFGDLPFLYKGAAGTIYPSSFEGFGIPVLESLTMRTPVLAGKGSAMEEAGGKQALYADPFQVEEFAAQISKLINDQSLSTGMLSGVEEHLAKFTSKKIASDLERVYNSVL